MVTATKPRSHCAGIRRARPAINIAGEQRWIVDIDPREIGLRVGDAVMIMSPNGDNTPGTVVLDGDVLAVHADAEILYDHVRVRRRGVKQ